MNRRHQFTLKALFVVMSITAIGCVIWVRLPPIVRLPLIGSAIGLLIWAIGLLDVAFDSRTLDWVVRGNSKQRHVVKRRDDEEDRS